VDVRRRILNGIERFFSGGVIVVFIWRRMGVDIVVLGAGF
jgi:hypothetical protein